MISPQELSALRDRLKQLVVKDIGATLEALQAALPEQSDRTKEVLNLTGQWEDLRRKVIKQIISSENELLTTNQIRSATLDIITALRAEDFAPAKPKATTGGGPQLRTWVLGALVLLGAVLANK